MEKLLFFGLMQIEIRFVDSREKVTHGCVPVGFVHQFEGITPSVVFSGMWGSKHPSLTLTSSVCFDSSRPSGPWRIASQILITGAWRLIHFVEGNAFNKNTVRDNYGCDQNGRRSSHELHKGCLINENGKSLCEESTEHHYCPNAISVTHLNFYLEFSSQTSSLFSFSFNSDHFTGSNGTTAILGSFLISINDFECEGFLIASH